MSNPVESRDILKSGSEIHLETVGGSQILRSCFVIEKYLGSGSSAICYRAQKKSGEKAAETDVFEKETGTLKELYPRDIPESDTFSFHFIRDSSAEETRHNQLRACSSCIESFTGLRGEFRSAYVSLREAVSANGELSLYCPHFDVYKGIAPDSDPNNYTYYIWTPSEPTTTNFFDFIKACADAVPERRLQNLKIILQSVRRLTACINKLHGLLLLHLDIKPANFGIRLDSDGSLVDGITLYDINSLYNISGMVPAAGGTPGFSSPDVLAGDVDNYSIRSDIYSIGATLFHAIALVDGKNLIYSDKDYADIPLLVSRSAYFSDETKDMMPDLRRQLSTILSRCLCLDNIRNTYDDTYELGVDLDKALSTLELIIGVERKSEEHPEDALRLQRFNLEEHLNSSIRTGAAGTVQYLLHSYPLYNYTDDSGNINILVLGSGLYAFKFVDIALEMAQTLEGKARITIAGNDMDVRKQAYLDARPAFPEFVSIDGSTPRKEAYGYLSFLNVNTAELSGSKADETWKRICAAPKGTPEKGYTYIFLALEDTLNVKMAAECGKRFGSSARNVLIGRTVKSSPAPSVNVTDKAAAKSPKCVHIVPLSVYDTIETHEDFALLEQMALNIHLLWTGSLENIGETVEDFQNPYNYDSSFSAALSVKYKLRYLLHLREKHCGRLLEFPAEDADKVYPLLKFPAEDADKVYPLLDMSSAENAASVRKLVMLEHRRWVINMAAAGWRRMEEFIPNGTKDSDKRLHLCLLHSDESWALTEAPWAEKETDKETDEETLRPVEESWTKPGKTALQDLDEMDTMSIRLFQYFLKQSSRITPAAVADEIAAMRALVEGDSQLKNAFNAYVIVLNQLANRSERERSGGKMIKLYKYYLSMFRLQLRKCTDAIDTKEIEHGLDRIKKKIFPILEAYSFTDYKTKDRVIIENLPFILTYSKNLKLCVPLIVERNGHSDPGGLFANVASSLMLNPETVTYVADGRLLFNGFAELEKALKYAENMMDAHRLQTGIELILFLSPNHMDTAELKSRLCDSVKRLKIVDLWTYDAGEHAGKNGIGGVVGNWLSFVRNRPEARFFAIERNDTRISGYIESRSDFPSFEFDSIKQRFNASAGCRLLDYLPACLRPHLTAEDMFLFKGKLCSFTEPELQASYGSFWDLYRHNETAWKQLCSALRSASDDEIFNEIIPTESTGTRLFRYRLPSYALPGAKKLLEEMSAPEIGFFLDGSGIEEDSSQSFLFTAVVDDRMSGGLSGLLSDPECLRDASALRIFRRKNRVAVRYDRLEVRCMPFRLLDEYVQEDLPVMPSEIFATLADQGWIGCYRFSGSADDQEVSFCYASPQIKQLLTSEGRIFELYVYYKLIETGYFDEVRAGIEVVWNTSRLTNELDIVAVKGFRTMVLEIKTVSDIQQDFYNKLFAISINFGANNRSALIVDQPLGAYNSPSNAMQNTRGDEYDIITIRDRADIDNIGECIRGYMQRFTGTGSAV